MNEENYFNNPSDEKRYNALMKYIEKPLDENFFLKTLHEYQGKVVNIQFFIDERVRNEYLNIISEIAEVTSRNMKDFYISSFKKSLIAHVKDVNKYIMESFLKKKLISIKCRGFEKTLIRFQGSNYNYKVALGRKESLESAIESLQQSCIDCFDSLWKHLKKYLQELTGLAEIPSNPKFIFRLANEKSVIENYKIWDEYNAKVIGVRDASSETNVSEMLKIISRFIKDAIKIYEEMASEKFLDLDAKYLVEVEKVLNACLEGREVWAYGSRVKGNANRFSDLDLVVFDADDISISNAQESFEESSLPFVVSLLSWEKIPDEFYDNIKKKYVVI